VAHTSWPDRHPFSQFVTRFCRICHRGNKFGPSFCAIYSRGTRIALPPVIEYSKTVARLTGSEAKSVMLRITTINSVGSPAVVKLEGKLLEPWISELLEACRAARKQDEATTLDLAGLSYIDTPGTIALRDLIRRGVAVTGCSPLVTELLKETLR
jgi:ABC-type transporter Mla MlaB component